MSVPSTSTRRYRRRPTEITNASPLVQKIFALVDAHQITLSDLAERSGVRKTTISGWQSKSNPTIDNAAGVVGVLGYSIVLQPMGRGRPKSA